MKKGLLLIILLVFGWVGSASATYTYTDTFSSQQWMSANWVSTGVHSGYWKDGDTLSWTFNITGDGYNSSTQTVTSATVTFHLGDDLSTGALDWMDKEWAKLELDSNTFNWEVDPGYRDFTLSSFNDLNTTGKVDVTLTATQGDFRFYDATLTVKAETPAPVPEPGTLVLLGSGLAGLAFYRRKRTK